ncbi:MAG: hypothetical protein MJE63_03325, partial [Proteobacteria bacterium]|nr:hypothetical protein [Pseudomonadota bacterium]
NLIMEKEKKGVWTVTSYMIPFGMFTLFFGPLGDRIGKVRLLKIVAIRSLSLKPGISFRRDPRDPMAVIKMGFIPH